MADVKELNINNTTYDIKAKTVVNNNGTKLSMWSGTKQEYDNIATKDPNQLYFIEDDTDTTLSLLELLYPVGSLYIASGNLSTCPLSVLGVGTWSLKTTTTLVTGVSSIAPIVGNGKALGLTNGTSNAGVGGKSNYGIIAYPELYGHNNDITDPTGTQLVGTIGITTDPTKSGIEANITSTTLAVTIWERVS